MDNIRIGECIKEYMFKNLDIGYDGYPYYKEDDFLILLQIKVSLEKNNFYSSHKFDMLKIIQHMKNKISYMIKENISRDYAVQHIPLLINCLSSIRITSGYEYVPLLKDVEEDGFLSNIAESENEVQKILDVDSYDEFNKPDIDEYNAVIEILKSEKFKKYDLIFYDIINNKLIPCFQNKKYAEEIQIKSKELRDLTNKILEYLKE